MSLLDLLSGLVGSTDKPKTGVPGPIVLPQSTSDPLTGDTNPAYVSSGPGDSLDPQAEKRVKDAAILAHLRDPEVLATLKAKSESGIPGQILQGIMNVAAYTPRGGHIANVALGQMAKGNQKGLDEYNAQVGMGNQLEESMRKDEELGFKRADEARKSTEFGQKQTVALAESDPNSPLAKYTHELNAKADNLTEEQKQNLILIPPDQLKNMGQYTNELRNAVIKQQENSLKREDLRSNRDQLSQDRADRLSSTQDQKDMANRDKQSKAFQEDMDSFRGRAGAFGKTQETLNQISRAKGILQQFSDGNLPKAQIGELTEAWSRAISGGSGSEQRIKNLLPSSYKGDVNAFMSKLTNTPRGAGQEDFVKLISDSLDREEGINNDIIKGAQVQRALSGKHKSYRENNPDDFKSDLQHIGIDPETQVDETGRYKPSRPVAGPTATPKSSGPTLQDIEAEMARRKMKK